MSALTTDSTDERFFAKVAKEPSGCWIWTGVRSSGYGRFWGGDYYENGRPLTVLAHRWAYERFIGPLPPRPKGQPGAVGVCVLHRCDTPACVNPEHLFLGTQADNVSDCAEKGRRNLRRIRKLTPEQRAEIRSRYAAGGATQDGLAAEFGVCQGTVWETIHGRQRKSRAARR